METGQFGMVGRNVVNHAGVEYDSVQELAQIHLLHMVGDIVLDQKLTINTAI